MAPNCERRPYSTASPQALMMMNNPFVVQQAEALATRIRSTATEPAGQVKLAWRMVFGRVASELEFKAAEEFLTQHSNTTPEASATALSHFCQSLISSNGFLYVD
jgi:hypothetical protein